MTRAAATGTAAQNTIGLMTDANRPDVRLVLNLTFRKAVFVPNPAYQTITIQTEWSNRKMKRYHVQREWFVKEFVAG
jgi:hypothetical protein